MLAEMTGWVVPPPKPPEKTPQEFERERDKKVRWLTRKGYIVSPRVERAMRKVQRERFIPPEYRDYAYLEVPLPLPGVEATISCPHSYPLFYEPLGLEEGQSFLEVGVGSGYGSALAWELVGPGGTVTAVEIDSATLGFARRSLTRAGYDKVVLVKGDGGKGHPARGPYDRISVTAACPRVPPPLLEQLRTGGRLIAPVVDRGIQNLQLLEKTETGVESRVICEVVYVDLQGKYGLL